MKSFILCIVCFYSSLCIYGQIEIKKYVETKSIPISSIDPDSANYADLESIGNAIGERRIVMIGEQDHGDASTMLAKSRLVKYLHEKKGFKILAIESDFFGLNYGWEKTQKSKDSIIQFLKGNVFGVWTGCYACDELFFQFLPNSYKTPNPIIVTGFDMQMFLRFSYSNLIYIFDSVLVANELPITKSPAYGDSIKPLIKSIYGGQKAITDQQYNKRNTILLEILAELRTKLSPNDFWVETAQNLVALNLYYQNYNADFATKLTLRDEQMSKNLAWICRYKYPAEKIIVWAASEHVAKYKDSAEGGKKLVSMGSFFCSDTSLDKSTYVLGFTSYAGETGRISMKKTSIPKPKTNGFETWIKKDFEYAFTDFKQFNDEKSENFYLKALNHFTAFKKDWTTIFDGIFFIRDMKPCQQ